jgi:serine/threonine protein kinase
MAGVPWKSFEGEKVGQNYLLEALTAIAGDRAWFRGRHPERPGDTIAVVCAPANKRAWLPCVAELKHPNLRVILGAGTCVVKATGLRYCAMEGAALTLADSLPEEAPHSTTVVRELIGHIVAALDHLHERNLVCCRLSPAAIARIDGKWKLADFTYASPAGGMPAPLARKMLALSPHAPPEAFDGLVAPAWDIYSLGVTIHQCLQRSMPAGRTARIPAPFESIVKQCLDPDPGNRLTLADIATMLRLPFRDGGSRRLSPAAAETGRARSRSRALRWLPTGA